MSYVQGLISKAEELLIANPYDEGHDLSHHQRVWENAKTIALKLNEPVDLNVLQIAVMWHDTVVGEKEIVSKRRKHVDETIQYLKKYMTELHTPDDFQDRVILAIDQHEFNTKNQTTVEAKILFDADKLDALDPRRYRKLMVAVKQKKLSKFHVLFYVQAAKFWLKTMRSRYHYEISKQIHDDRIKALLQDTEAINLGLELGMDIKKIVK